MFKRKDRLKKLSSTTTIFLKLFFPIFWVVFFGSITVALFIYTPEGLNTRGQYFRWFWFAVFIGWSALMYFTVFRLKRVEGDSTGLVISNYFKHIFLPFESIQSFNDRRFGPFLLVWVKFNRPTLFGKSIYFLASRTRFNDFVAANAQRLEGA